MRRHGARLALLLTLAAAVPGAGSASELLSVVGTDPRLVGARRAIAEGTHARLLFGQEVTRVALGNERILDVQLLTPRELLVLGKAMGQSSITVSRSSSGPCATSIRTSWPRRRPTAMPWCCVARFRT